MSYQPNAIHLSVSVARNVGDETAIPPPPAVGVDNHNQDNADSITAVGSGNPSRPGASTNNGLTSSLATVSPASTSEPQQAAQKLSGAAIALTMASLSISYVIFPRLDCCDNGHTCHRGLFQVGGWLYMDRLRLYLGLHGYHAHMGIRGGYLGQKTYHAYGTKYLSRGQSTLCACSRHGCIDRWPCCPRSWCFWHGHHGEYGHQRYVLSKGSRSVPCYRFYCLGCWK